MPVKYHKDTQKRRGHRTMGWGRVGQHRNKGQRGGVGKTTGRLKHKRTTYILQKNAGFPDPDWILGKKGFKMPVTTQRIYKINAINIKDVEHFVDSWAAAKLIEKKGDTYIIDLAKVNFNKLLGKGNITKKLDITVKFASEKAVEKCKEAKCKLTLTAENDEE